jgi:hypothetical protein
MQEKGLINNCSLQERRVGTLPFDYIKGKKL